MILIMILVISFVLIYAMPIHVKLEAKRDEQYDTIVIRLQTLYGLLKLKTEIPFINLTIENGKLVIKYKARIKSVKTNRLMQYFNKMMTPQEMENSISLLKRGYRYKSAFIYLLSKTRVRSMKLHLAFGAGDAALTGILAGLSWIVVGSILSILMNRVDTRTEDIAVHPSFDRVFFSLALGCIIHVKMGHIINTVIKMLLIYRRLTIGSRQQGQKMKAKI